MRIHGDRVIRRRDITIGHYPDAKPYLVEDFQGLCGYCGKNSKYIHCTYEIDHFVPQSVDLSRKDDYSNLVFSCKRCNRIKSDKWPTMEKDIPYEMGKGFVDPASEEYDDHLERDERGRIVSKTKLGEYICAALKFDIRKTDLFWEVEKVNEIEEKLEDLHSKGELSLVSLSFYVELNKELKRINCCLAKEGE